MGADVVSAARSVLACRSATGGPHAAYMTAKKEFQRQMPGRIVGVTIDATANPRCASRSARATAHPPREGNLQHLHGAGAARGDGQHVCVYHGPRRSARDRRTHPRQAACLWHALAALGHRLQDGMRFDTVRVWPRRVLRRP
jgi:glycine dehydrogenase